MIKRFEGYLRFGLININGRDYLLAGISQNINGRDYLLALRSQNRYDWD
jgi:hypothetical protein